MSSASCPTSSCASATSAPSSSPTRRRSTTPGLAERLAARIRRHGPLPYEQYVEAALYDDQGGFYAAGGSAGRRGDFVTSPEVGPLFGTVMARALDAWWMAQGRPDPWFVVEAGAGPGTLARSILAAVPACGPALRYILVERSSVQRARHGDHLALEPPDEAFAALPVDDEEPVVTGVGPITLSLGELPAVPLRGIVLANELLDNLPFALCEWSGTAWREIFVGVDGDRFTEQAVPARPSVAAVAATFAGEPAPGARLPVALGAATWLRDVLDRLEQGRLVVVDYTATTAELLGRPQSEWLRTYRTHARGGDVLADPGSKDITIDVPLDQLALVARPSAVGNQVDFLRAHGLDDLVDEGRRLWADGAGRGDLAALKARSRIREAEALTDPAGLGGFTIAEWIVAPPASPEPGAG